jgi:hypothetical protein
MSNNENIKPKLEKSSRSIVVAHIKDLNNPEIKALPTLEGDKLKEELYAIAGIIIQDFLTKMSDQIFQAIKLDEKILKSPIKTYSSLMANIKCYIDKLERETSFYIKPYLNTNNFDSPARLRFRDLLSRYNTLKDESSFFRAGIGTAIDVCQSTLITSIELFKIKFDRMPNAQELEQIKVNLLKNVLADSSSVSLFDFKEGLGSHLSESDHPVRHRFVLDDNLNLKIQNLEIRSSEELVGDDIKQIGCPARFTVIDKDGKKTSSINFFNEKMLDDLIKIYLASIQKNDNKK